MGKVWTVGYGILQGTHRERKVAFQKRLRYIASGIGKPVTVIDVRKIGSGSRNGEAFKQGGKIHYRGMCSTVRHAGKPGQWFVYEPEPELGNTWGPAKWQLESYAFQLALALKDPCVEQAMREAFDRVKAIAVEGSRAVVLLCGCRKAYKANGTTWNCHRVPLAEALIAELGEGWEVKHL